MYSMQKRVLSKAPASERGETDRRSHPPGGGRATSGLPTRLAPSLPARLCP